MIPCTLYAGTVVSVQGTNPGPASGISYTIDINMGATVPRRVTGIKPTDGRLPDIVHTVAALPGTHVKCLDVGGYMEFSIKESFDYDESCQ